MISKFRNLWPLTAIFKKEEETFAIFYINFNLYRNVFF